MNAPDALPVPLYGQRPVSLCRLDVEDWDPRTRILSFPAHKQKTRVPHDVHVDTLSAAILDRCVRGKQPKEPIFSAPGHGLALDRHAWCRVVH